MASAEYANWNQAPLARVAFLPSRGSEPLYANAEDQVKQALHLYLFSQGVVSGEAFVGDSDFRKKLNEKLPAALKLSDVASRPDTSQYEVVFGIISNSPAATLDISFFSKVTLRNARKRLRNCGYLVTLKKIQKV